MHFLPLINALVLAAESTTSPIGGTHSTSVDPNDPQFGSTGTSRLSSTVQGVLQESIHELIPRGLYSSGRIRKRKH